MTGKPPVSLFSRSRDGVYHDMASNMGVPVLEDVGSDTASSAQQGCCRIHKITFIMAPQVNSPGMH